jgi:hypothetical protein
MNAPFTTRVASRTDSKRSYQVRVSGPDQATCDCFKFRRYNECHHLAPAIVQYLHWRSQQRSGDVPDDWKPILGRAEQAAFERSRSGETVFERLARQRSERTHPHD